MTRIAKFRHYSDSALHKQNGCKHLFRYLKGTLDYSLTYGLTDTSELFQTWSDADHGGDKDLGRSTGAYIVKIGTGAISWRSKLQTMVTLSTTEAEYIAAVHAGQEILWLRNLFSEMGYECESASTLFTDNQSSISVSKTLSIVVGLNILTFASIG